MDISTHDWERNSFFSYLFFLIRFQRFGTFCKLELWFNIHIHIQCDDLSLPCFKPLLSCYLPGDPSQYNTREQGDTPVFQAHGDQDPVVSYTRGQLTSQIVSKMVKEHQFITYEGMMHEATMDEMEDIKSWMDQKLRL